MLLIWKLVNDVVIEVGGCEHRLENTVHKASIADVAQANWHVVTRCRHLTWLSLFWRIIYKKITISVCVCVTISGVWSGLSLIKFGWLSIFSWFFKLLHIAVEIAVSRLLIIVPHSDPILTRFVRLPRWFVTNIFVLFHLRLLPGVCGGCGVAGVVWCWRRLNLCNYHAWFQNK